MSQATRYAVVTGATSGFGRAAARHLAAQGDDVLLVGRDPERAAEVVEEIRARGGGEVEIAIADLSSIAEVDRLGREIVDAERPIDLLVNNAGAMFGLRRKESVDGIEMTMALNHFGYVGLTRRLVDLVAATEGRIVNVASDAYSFAGGRFDFDEWQATNRYRPHRQYGRSKLANILFTQELARRVPEIEVVAWAPSGLTATRFAYGAHPFAPAVMKLMHPFSLKTDDAVASLLILLDRPPGSVVSGTFLVETEPDGVPVATSDDAARLWELSESLISARLGPRT